MAPRARGGSAPAPVMRLMGARQPERGIREGFNGEEPPAMEPTRSWAGPLGAAPVWKPGLPAGSRERRLRRRCCRLADGAESSPAGRFGRGGWPRLRGGGQPRARIAPGSPSRPPGRCSRKDGRGAPPGPRRSTAERRREGIGRASVPGRSGRRQPREAAVVDQGVEVPDHRSRERPVPDQQADLDVPVEGGLGQVGRSDEDRGAVGDDHLGVEHPRRRARPEGARVVEDPRSPDPRPLLVPETVRETPDEDSALDDRQGESGGGSPGGLAGGRHQGDAGSSNSSGRPAGDGVSAGNSRSMRSNSPML